MVVLAFCAKGLGLYSTGDGTASCLCINDLSDQISVSFSVAEEAGAAA